jgi:hypothetical protein
MSEDDPSLGHCPICQDKECQRHLLARFDELGDQGAFGVGLAGGALFDAKEIEQVLQRARLAWVQSVRATGKPKAPPWIMKVRGLGYYFDALGGIDVDKYDSDEDAVHDVGVETDMELWHAREDFLWEALSSCGWLGDRTEEEFNSPVGLSTTYLYWWANEPREIVERFRAKLHEGQAHQAAPQRQARAHVVFSPMKPSVIVWFEGHLFAISVLARRGEAVARRRKQ